MARNKFKKGNIPWNKGKKLPYWVREKIIKGHLGVTRGEKNGQWKGDNVSYRSLHTWVRKYKPKTEHCEICGQPKEFNDLDLANITGIYNRDFLNYKWMCRLCHNRFDSVKIGRDKNGRFTKKSK